MKLFMVPLAPNPTKVMLYLAERAGHGQPLPIEQIVVNTLKGRHREPEHLARNPFGTLPVLDVSDDRQPRVLTLYAELQDALAHADAATHEVTRSLVVLLLAEARRAMPGDASGSAMTSLVGDALAFIQRHGLEPISLRDVAKAVHRTPSHVANVVKQETGFSVGEWITAGRVAEAAARLAHTDDSLEEVATRVGWTDKTHLTRQFKAAYGVTPAAFRRVRRGA